MMSLLSFISRNPGYATSNIRKLWVVRKALKSQVVLKSSCAACGKEKYLHAHHIVPVNIDPLIAADASNLMTLCKYCHFVVGHGGNWRKYVNDVISLASLLLEMIVHEQQNKK